MATIYHDVVFRYEPAFLGLAFCVASLYTAIQGTATKLSNRQQKLFLALLILSDTVYLGRATYTAAACASEEQIVPALSQVILQSAVFLAFLAAGETLSLSPYLLVWLITLSVEICSLALSKTVCHGEETLGVSLSVTSIVLLSLLSCGALSIGWLSSTDLMSAEQEPLLANSEHGSKTKALSRSDLPFGRSQTAAESSGGLASDSNSAASYNDSDSDADDDDESFIKTRRLKFQERGGVLQYCLSYKVFVPFVIPFRNPKLLFFTAIVLFNMVVQRALNVFVPLLLGRAIQKLTDTWQFPLLELILYVLGTVLASDFCGLRGVNDALLERLGAWSRQTLVVSAFDRILSLCADFHDDKNSGEVIKAVEQAESLSEVFHEITVEVLPGMLDLFIAMWYVNYLFDIYATLIVVTVIIAFFFATVFASRPLRRSRRVVAKAERVESELLYETIGNWSIVTYFSRRQFEVGRINRTAGGVATANVRSNDFSILMFALQEAAERLGQVSILLLAARRVAMGTSSIGDFVTVERYWSTISQPLYDLGYTFRHFATNLTDAERLLQLFDAKISVQDQAGAQPLQIPHGQIEFSGVNFAYKTSKAVIQDLSFTVSPGQTVAFVGSTGSGKSTILKLLMRMYDVDGGSICIDGQDIRTVTLDSLRQCFGLVPQDSALFNTTILENVRYGRLDASDDEVRSACEAARIHAKIMSLPAGYHTRVGEKGVKLSGGERQRIAIARVLLKRPQIVVLDEATSAMDTQTEIEVHEALQELTRTHTSLVIAHRLSTIVDADMIMVIGDGRLVQQGTHDELLARGGKYRHLWESQIAKDRTHGLDPTQTEVQ